jgi:hypothetical protein
MCLYIKKILLFYCKKMSTEHLVRRHTLPRPFRNISSNMSSLFRDKLTCILCNVSLDSNVQEHRCTLRPDDKDIIISKHLTF